MPSIKPFALKLTPKGLHGSIIPTVALALHTAGETILFYKVLIVVRAILRTSVNGKIKWRDFGKQKGRKISNII